MATSGRRRRGLRGEDEAGRLVARLDNGDVLRHDGECVRQRHRGEDAEPCGSESDGVVLAVPLREDRPAQVFQRSEGSAGNWRAERPRLAAREQGLMSCRNA